MNNLINPYDSGKFQLNQRIEINDFVRKAEEQLKITLVQAQIEALGQRIELTTSKTRFQGQRLWFVCPSCEKRVGTLYKQPIRDMLTCRKCSRLQYQKH